MKHPWKLSATVRDGEWRHTCELCGSPELWSANLCRPCYDKQPDERRRFTNHKSTSKSFPRGERAPRAKLTADQVREIDRRLLAGEAHKTMAREYGVAESTISAIRRGTSWAHITRRKTSTTISRLTEAQARDIDRRLRAGERQGDIAKHHGIAQSTVSAIAVGVSWRRATGRKAY